MSSPAGWLERHRERLDGAERACRDRSAFSPFVESPRRALHPEGAKQRGLEAFRAHLGALFEGTGPGGEPVGGEVSPYTAEPLGASYRRPAPDAIFDALERAWPAWRDATVDQRIGACLEALDRIESAAFEMAFATMHTTGQGFVMAFAGSGANSLDRGLEALVYARRALAEVVSRADFRRSFGRGEVALVKRFRAVPRGPAVVIACGSYPAWNAYPAIVANLATGNPVVVKPHPATILPVAIAVRIFRQALADAGFDPDLLILAPDTASEPITDALAFDPRAAIVDFTGGPAYGERLERECRALVFTETAGCNAVIAESAADMGAAMAAVARGLCLFSGQMCTTPQNVFIPESADYPATRDALVAAIDEISSDPQVAAGVCGAVHSPRTLEALAALESDPGDGARVIRPLGRYDHPEFSGARTATPLIIEVDPGRSSIHRREHFGPIAFVLRCADRDEALERAATDARERGAIASYAYSTDGAYRERVEQALWRAGASVGFNLIGHAPINYTAAFSDYHVTGLNPAGNACLTDLAFVASRFRIVQSKTEVERASQ